MRAARCFQKQQAGRMCRAGLQQGGFFSQGYTQQVACINELGKARVPKQVKSGPRHKGAGSIGKNEPAATGVQIQSVACCQSLQTSAVQCSAMHMDGGVAVGLKSQLTLSPLAQVACSSCSPATVADRQQLQQRGCHKPCSSVSSSVFTFYHVHFFCSLQVRSAT